MEPSRFLAWIFEVVSVVLIFLTAQSLDTLSRPVIILQNTGFGSVTPMTNPCSPVLGKKVLESETVPTQRTIIVEVYYNFSLNTTSTVLEDLFNQVLYEFNTWTCTFGMEYTNSTLNQSLSVGYEQATTFRNVRTGVLEICGEAACFFNPTREIALRGLEITRLQLTGEKGSHFIGIEIYREEPQTPKQVHSDLRMVLENALDRTTTCQTLANDAYLSSQQFTIDQSTIKLSYALIAIYGLHVMVRFWNHVQRQRQKNLMRTSSKPVIDAV